VLPIVGPSMRTTDAVDAGCGWQPASAAMQARQRRKQRGFMNDVLPKPLILRAARRLPAAPQPQTLLPERLLSHARIRPYLFTHIRG
jgi:hypothetical protein